MSKERELEDWIDAYCKYAENTESAAIFHKWTALSCVSAALQRKCWFKFGIYNILTNLYTVLVAEPGVCRKTKAMSIGRSILKNIPLLKIGPTVVASYQALYCELEEARQESTVPKQQPYNNGLFIHSSLTLFSGEFEQFLGKKGDNSQLIANLTALYDGEEDKFEYKAKQATNNTVYNPWLNLLAATTPSSLAQSFPVSAIGGGLSRRISFVYASKRAKPIPIPEALDPTLKSTLERDLTRISYISGEFNFTPESKEWWIEFYTNYRHDSPNRICQNPKFLGWYSVKPDLIIKIAMLCAASRRDGREVQTEDLERALSIVTEIEPGMEFAFSGVGRSDSSEDIRYVESIIQEYGTISEEQLFMLIWRDVDKKRFDDVVWPTMKEKGTVKMSFKKQGNRTVAVYTYSGGEENVSVN